MIDRKTLDEIIELDKKRKQGKLVSPIAVSNALDAAFPMALMLREIHQALDLTVVTKDGVLTANGQILFKVIKRILGRDK